jgi:hypothetical protein
MAGKLETVTLVPRFSGFLGAGTHVTAGLNVTDFAGATVHAWRSALIGSGPSFAVSFEESIDQENWTVCSGGAADDPQANTEIVFSITLKKRWFRVKIDLGGTGAPGVTCWVVAEFERRKE